MKKIIYILPLIGLVFTTSCNDEEKKVSVLKSYTILVNYNGVSEPSSDTIYLQSYNEPRLWVDQGTSTLIADDVNSPIAVYVRSFKILSENETN